MPLVRLLCALAALLALPASAAAAGREVVLVANAESGTVSVVDARRLVVLREIDVLPDGRRAAFGEDDPVQALIGQQVVEAAGGENFVQDQDVSPDGRTLYVSRGHRGDIAAFDLASGRMLWKLTIGGLRSDHMTLSEDGSRLYVSALTENRVEVVDTARAEVVGTFPTGEWPHDSHFSHDGKRLYNASIGNIITPEEVRSVKPGTYALTVVDPVTLAVQRRHEFDRGIRPYVITRDETRMFAQLSMFHGLVEIDPRDGRVVREAELPIDPGVTEEDFDFEAPHHGLAMSRGERTLCAAGRASDYVALVATDTLSPRALIDVGDAPSWAENGPDGRYCFVPNNRDATLSVISYDERREVARIPVGRGPKHVEAAVLPRAVVCGTPGVPGCDPGLRLSSRCLSRGRLRLRLDGDPHAVREVRFAIGRRAVRRDRLAPFTTVVGRRALRGSRGRLRAVALLRDGDPERAVLKRAVPGCGR